MDVTRDQKNKKLWLSQEKYVERVLEKFNMKNAKPASTPLTAHFKLSEWDCPQLKEEKLQMSKIPHAFAVGSLMCGMVHTRLDIAHAVGVVSRFVSNLRKAHWEVVKWIMRYLRRTTELCLHFDGFEPILEDYTDSDMI